MDEVASGLWISNISDAREQSIGADAVITVCQDEIRDNVSDDTSYSWFNLADGFAHYGGECTYDLFSIAADHLLNAYLKYDRVLIHCHMGQSRSVTVAAAVLGVLDGSTYEEMEAFIAESRPQIQPNKTLVGFAKRYIEENS